MSDYPEDNELQKIREWDADDFDGLMNYVSNLWHWPEYISKIGKDWHLITGGWSGNEEIIAAIKDNCLLWILYWYSSTRGGEHIFNKSSVE